MVLIVVMQHGLILPAFTVPEKHLCDGVESILV